ncbi:hypothetical protein [Spirosoma fluminis]
MEKLFEDKERTNFNYANYQHDTYDFYDNSAIEKFAIIREKLNEWYNRFPESGKRQLKGDFKSQFDSAFFELFVHELFFRQGFTLLVHPTISNSTKNPDFLAKKGSLEIYLEARVSHDKSKEEKLLESRQDVIQDALNSIDSKRYGIKVIEIIFLSSRQARLRKIRDHFQKIIDEHAKSYASNKNTNTYWPEKYITYNDEDIRVSISLGEVDFDLTRPIISSLGGSYVGGSDQAIRDAIKAKAYRYGTLDKPYIICINSLSIKQTYTEDVYDALFGSKRSQPFEYRNDRCQKFQTSYDGLFAKDSTPSYSNVSGVFITKVMPTNLQVAKHWLVKHPYTENDLNFNRIDLSHIQANIDKIEEVTKKSIGEIVLPVEVT